MQKDKSRSMDIHVIKRFKERFNFDCSEEDLNHIIHMIKSNEQEGKEPIYKQSNSRTVWKINYKGLEFLTVYHHGKHRLCTVMPVEWLKTLKYTPKGTFDEEGDEIGLLMSEKEALNITIDMLDSVIDQLNSVNTNAVVCSEDREEISKEDLEVCKQILKLIANNESLELTGLQTEERVL